MTFVSWARVRLDGRHDTFAASGEDARCQHCNELLTPVTALWTYDRHGETMLVFHEVLFDAPTGEARLLVCGPCASRYHDTAGHAWSPVADWHRRMASLGVPD